MSRVTARIAATAFTFVAAAASFAPASAQTTAPVALPSVSGIAAFVEHVNPRLPFAKAQSYANSVIANAMRTGVDPRLIMSIVTVESGWNARAVSRVGALGLGQLMPGTARTLRVNPRVPSDNLRGTSNYLSALVSHFASKPNGLKLAIASYNAGPKAVQRYNGIPPYAETQHYVVKVLHVMHDLDRRIATTLTSARPAQARVRVTPEETQWTPTGNEQLPAIPVEAMPGGATAAQTQPDVPAAAPATP